MLFSKFYIRLSPKNPEAFRANSNNNFVITRSKSTGFELRLIFDLKDPPHDICLNCRFWNQDPDQTRMNFRKIFFSTDSWDSLLQPVLVAKLIPLANFCQNDHFVSQGH